ncbi:glycosyltransferase family 2 protein [Natronolimnohabitans innermongolicus]|uniref:Putative Glycosyl transferase, family 2 n=1 Tax=Natronolimnohabitans innermongolicus JCM 12255 TaxID=1227499 RepID=L9XGJ2_9EURY|nr:glycosyltransferase family 2 protein [Natronolimnohabitans innermongolicus]ELY60732.1 putative Glycosyl transferase, family 2 [Natronolimnohabitans innermongolicus JCM 12255]
MAATPTQSDDGEPLVSYVIPTYNRPDDLAEAVDSVLEQSYRPIEVIVVSGSTDETASMFESGARFDRPEVTLYDFPTRLSPPEARNIGYERASGEILVTTDDDAVFASPDATDIIVSRFQREADVGVLAFQSRDYYDDEILRKEIPDPPDFETDPTEEYRTTSFIGVGTAIRRSALESAGDFPDNFEYGFEEMDLSIRVLDSGYDILYVPSVVVRHKKSPTARRPDHVVLELLVGNRIRLAVRNLPWRYVVFSTLLWSAYGFARTGFKIGPMKRIFETLWQQRNELLAQRNVVDGMTISLVKSRDTMLFFWLYGPHPRRLLGNPERFTW